MVRNYGLGEVKVTEGLLVQQNEDTGMPAYFLPLTTGSKKHGHQREMISGVVRVL